MNDFVMSGEVLVAILGVVVSLVFKYFPRVRVWFAGLASELKSALITYSIGPQTYENSISLALADLINLGRRGSRMGISVIATS